MVVGSAHTAQIRGVWDLFGIDYFKCSGATDTHCEHPQIERRGPGEGEVE